MGSPGWIEKTLYDWRLFRMSFGDLEMARCAVQSNMINDMGSFSIVNLDFFLDFLFPVFPRCSSSSSCVINSRCSLCWRHCYSLSGGVGEWRRVVVLEICIAVEWHPKHYGRRPQMPSVRGDIHPSSTCSPTHAIPWVRVSAPPLLISPVFRHGR